MTTPEDVRIPAGADQLAAYLYRPAGSGPTAQAPCIVMAHGFTATRDDGLPEYAEAFCQAGYVVVVFDYRGFGASTGTPRQLLDIGMQQTDYHTVVAWARRLDGVDPDRIALWGSSFSGGHVLAVAAADARIAAVVSQAPFTDGLATLRVQPPAFVPKALVAGVRDQLGAWRGRPPHLLPAVGTPGAFAAMTSPDAQPGFEAIVGAESLWSNEFSARVGLRLGLYRPGTKTAHLEMPLLICVCDDDKVTPPGPTVRAAQRAPRGELLHYPYGHFDIYHDPRVKADQVAFLQRAVPVRHE